MRTPREIYTDTQEHLGGADEKWFKWSFIVLLAAIALSFGTYFLQQAFGFVGMGINTVLFLILVWFLNTWLTSPTLVTGSWLAGLPFLRPFGFTADYLKDVVPFVLFWSCGIVLVNGVVPWFWWPFLSYLYVIAITIAMGIWAWYFKPEGKIVKDLSWKFLVVALVWALVGIPALSWVAPWFNSDAREEVRVEQLETQRQAERGEAAHNASVAAEKVIAAAIVAAEAEEALTQATGQPCAGRWEGLLDCVSITFSAGENYDRTAAIGTCLSMDPPDAANRVSLGGNDWRHIPIRPGVTIRFFDHPVGETILGATCG